MKDRNAKMSKGRQRLKFFLENGNPFLNLRYGKKRFFTFAFRPKIAELVDVCNKYDDSDVAIIIQGPIILEENFTLETVKIYRKIYPTAKIIVTTWDKEDEQVLKKIRDAGAEVILSNDRDLPKAFQFQSVNYEIKNTLAGLRTAEKEGYKYAVKVRSDSRFYYPGALSYCKELLDTFPIERDEIKVKSRIITTSMFTFINKCYNISQALLFGNINDLIRYFSCPYDNRDVRPNIPDNISTEEKLKLDRGGELWFTSHYLENIGHELKWTMDDYYDVLANYYIIVDTEAIDHFFHKYSRQEYWYKNYSEADGTLNRATHADWLLNYKNRVTERSL